MNIFLWISLIILSIDTVLCLDKEEEQGLAKIKEMQNNKANGIQYSLLNITGLDNFDKTTHRTPLMDAAYYDDYEEVENFCKAGSNIELISPLDGSTALMIASSRNNDKSVKALIEAGAIIDKKTKAGKSALSIAVISRFYESTEELLNGGADANQKFRDHQSILMLACAGGGGSDIVKLLIEHGADMHEIDDFGNTAIMFAAIAGDIDSIHVLFSFSASKTIINHQNNDGKTALMFAASRDHVNVLKSLIDYGAKLDLKEKHGYSAIKIASETSKIESFNMLAIEGADLTHLSGRYIPKDVRKKRLTRQKEKMTLKVEDL